MNSHEKLKQIKDIYAAFLDGAAVQMDSRQVESGDIFFALPGENTHGHNFVDDARARGAGMIVVEDTDYVDSDTVLVADSLQVLQALATHHRQQFTIPVIGITGSNGKTTTKEIVRTVLGTKYEVFFNPGNFNSQTGMSLANRTLLPPPRNNRSLSRKMSVCTNSCTSATLSTTTKYRAWALMPKVL